MDKIRVKAGSRRVSGLASSNRFLPIAVGAPNGASPRWKSVSLAQGLDRAHIVASQLPRMVTQSRSAALNQDMAVAYLKAARRNIVGPRGVRLISQVKKANGKADDKLAKKIEAVFHDWAKKEHCTVTGADTLRAVLNMQVSTKRIDGNFFAIKHFGPQFGKYGFQLQLVPLERLAIDFIRDERGSNRVENGIEFNEFGRVTAYYFQSIEYGQIKRSRVPANRVIHCFSAFETDQHLGWPTFHAGLRRMEQLDDLDQSQLAAARWASKKMAFVTRKVDALDDLPPPAEGDDGDDDGDADDGNGVWGMSEGQVVELEDGQDIKPLDFAYPGTDPAPFARHFQRTWAAGQGVSYSGVTGDHENLNYSSLVDARGEERSGWQISQQDLRDEFLQEVFECVLKGAVLTGHLKAPRNDPAALAECEWRFRGWPAVNGKEEAARNESDIKNTLRSPSQIVEQRGDSWPDLISRTARDLQDIAEARGVTVQELTAAMYGAGVPSQAPPDPNDDDGEDG